MDGDLSLGLCLIQFDLFCVGLILNWFGFGIALTWIHQAIFCLFFSRIPIPFSMVCDSVTL